MNRQTDTQTDGETNTQIQKADRQTHRQTKDLGIATTERLNRVILSNATCFF